MLDGMMFRDDHSLGISEAVRLPTHMIVRIKTTAHQLAPLNTRQVCIGSGGSDKPIIIKATATTSNALDLFAFCARKSPIAVAKTSSNSTMWRAVVCGPNTIARKMSTAHSRLVTALARGRLLFSCLKIDTR